MFCKISLSSYSIFRAVNCNQKSRSANQAVAGFLHYEWKSCLLNNQLGGGLSGGGAHSNQVNARFQVHFGGCNRCGTTQNGSAEDVSARQIAYGQHAIGR